MATASRFGDILTEPRSKEAKYNGEMSDTARTYLLEKLSELLTGIPMDRFMNTAMKWGTEWESEAFAQAMPVIADRFNCEVGRPTGEFAFVEHATEPYIGCSPDGVIGDDGLLEIKCPYNPVNHLRTLLAGAMPDKYEAQVQGSLWVTGRKWYAFCSYDPRLAKVINPLVVIRVERDEKFIKDLASKVVRFRDTLIQQFEQLTGGSPF